MDLKALTEVLNDLASRLDSQVVDIVSVQALTELKGDFEQRVFVDGLDSQEQLIGEYSEKPGYYSKDQFIKTENFAPTGKRGFKGERIVPSGKDFSVVKRLPKTMYLKKGYKELRDINGRPIDKINLDYSGSLKRAYRVFKFGDVVVFGQNDELEHKKIQGLTDKFGTWQQLTQAEAERVKEALADGVKLIMRNDTYYT